MTKQIYLPETGDQPGTRSINAERIRSIDLVRGLVMIIMALDHTRDLFHESSLIEDPVDLATTTPGLFFTRWITHLCAPVFVFLSGLSVQLALSQGSDKAGVRRLLFTRGLWLILLELTLVNFGIWFDIHFSVILLQVIAAIGAGFVLLSILLDLSPAALGLTGLIIVCLYGALPAIPLADGSLLKSSLNFLFSSQLIPLSPERQLLEAYPPLPWAGIMFMGYWAGVLYKREAISRRKRLLIFGLVCIGAFIVLRFINNYGDPAPWAAGQNGLYSFLSFINVSKYPPSLLYDLVTLGIMFLLLYVAESLSAGRFDFIRLYGKVPLFFYLLHWYLLHGLMFLMLYLQGFGPADFLFGFNFGRPQAESGLPLWGVYLVWISVVVSLYPLCRMYGRYKSAHREKKWLKYL